MSDEGLMRPRARPSASVRLVLILLVLALTSGLLYLRLSDLRQRSNTQHQITIQALARALSEPSPAARLAGLEAARDEAAEGARIAIGVVDPYPMFVLHAIETLIDVAEQPEPPPESQPLARAIWWLAQGELERARPRFEELAAQGESEVAERAAAYGRLIEDLMQAWPSP